MDSFGESERAALRARMLAKRRRLAEDVFRVHQRVRQLTDWRTYLREHATLVAVAGTGGLVALGASLLRSWRKPGREAVRVAKSIQPSRTARAASIGQRLFTSPWAKLAWKVFGGRVLAYVPTLLTRVMQPSSVETNPWRTQAMYAEHSANGGHLP